MIGSRGIPARAGGIEHVVEALTGELAARGHDVLVYGRRHYVPVGSMPAAGRLIVTAGLGGKHLDTITHTATAMFDVLRRKVDVVHLHSPGPALLSWIPALARLPIVLTIHAPDWRRDKWSAPARWMLRAGLAAGMRLAGAVTAVSQSLAGELSGRYPDKKVAYVANAVGPVTPRPPGDVARWKLTPQGYSLYVGRIVPEKRLDLLLKAWSMVDTHQPLVVVGEYQDSRYGLDCRRRAPGNVRFLGGLYGQDLAALYSHAALVVQPSVLEGMSLVLLEAAAYGRCILAADIPENSQVMGDCIVYFKQEDCTELTSQIRRCLYQRSWRDQMGLRARQLVESRYSWSAATDELERLYCQVITARASHA